MEVAFLLVEMEFFSDAQHFTAELDCEVQER